MAISLDLDEDLLYPESDGEPMAENTEQYGWIVMLKENLEILYAQDPNVFIAADLFWYPIQVFSTPAPRQAPDVMVVFGRPKGKRPSYKQWKEENQPAQVIFEILSPSNKTRQGEEAMMFKFAFYEEYGVEEYYIYDPEVQELEGYRRQGEVLIRIPTMNGWISPRLGIRFVWQPRTELEVYRPDGQRFLSPVEIDQQLQFERQQLQFERQRVEQERQRAEQERQRAEQERQRADRAEQAQREAVSNLRSLGLTDAQIAAALGLPTDTLS